MRFIKDGPDIPDALLHKLDEGKVMFFCGAGVSQQNAQLPDFIGLAKDVLKQLRVLEEAPANQILKLAGNKTKKRTKTIEEQLNVSSFVSTDLIFSELERDFETHDIETAVAKALNPPKGTRLKAHKIMLDLSTTQDGRTRLVTTNFDRLFEKCNRGVKAWHPPKLPDSNEIGSFQGVVYLHGAANKEYSGSDSRFVLSSAEFGRAYLAEGWATQFFKEIVSNYTVVFVGYAAEDPPVRYLLEALKKDDVNKIYAFELGTQKEAEKKWQKKGNVIAYDNYAQLWQTLEAWAKRTKDIKAWQDDIIKMARKGPRQLSPFEREQVVQLVLTKEGAQSFCATPNPPPASWLCVFDSAVRFDTPRLVVEDDGAPSSFDPFKRYKLDSDHEPEYIDPMDYLKTRAVPSEALDVFAINERDKNEIQTNPVIPMRGEAALSAGILPTRLRCLGEWIANISNQNIAVWWVARQSGIHPYVQRRIKYLLKGKANCASHILYAWQYVFDNWNPRADDSDPNNLEWHWFQENLGKFGWNKPTIRQYEELTKPRLEAEARLITSAIKRPPSGKKIDFTQLIELNIPYDDPPPDIEIHEDALAQIVAVWRRNIDTRINLEAEKGYSTMGRPLITQNPKRGQIYDLIDIALYYTSFLEDLLKLNPKQAQAEIKNWDNKDDDIYNRLRIWSLQFPELVPKAELAQDFSTMDRELFWHFSYQHDFLHILKVRWSDMSMTTKRTIEKRILLGRGKDKGEKQNEYIKSKAELTLARLDWLKNNGCNLSVSTETQMARLKKAIPTYTPEHAKYMDRSTDGQVQEIISNTDPTILLGLPLSDILLKAEEIIQKSDYSPNPHDPFAGLYKMYPLRAFAALCYEAKQGRYRVWAWRSFLYEEERKKDPLWMQKLIAEHIILMPDAPAIEVMYGSARWVLSISEHLPFNCLPIFERLIRQLIKQMIRLLHENHTHEDFAVKSRATDRDWGTEALNRPAGYIAQALFNDSRKDGLQIRQTFLRAWLDIVESMLALPEDQGRYALFIFMYNMRWFYSIDPQWTHDNLLQPLFKNNSDTTEAWWAGYRWGVPNPDIFQEIKPYLLERASHQNHLGENDNHKIVQLILLRWVYKDKTKTSQHITDKDFHKILLNTSDRVRSTFLWQFKQYYEGGENRAHWNKKRLDLFEKVWPFQKHVKTPQTTNRLIELAFSGKRISSGLVMTALPFLGEISEGHGFPFLYSLKNTRIVERHPELVLAVLCKVLPQEANDMLYTYGIEEVFDRIATASPKLKRDPRLIELQRRWSTR